MTYTYCNTASVQEFERAAELIRNADALIIAAGAGIGVDSGLPDFRGNQGFGRAYPALGKEQIDFYSIASPAAFQATPQLAWGFYGHRLAMYRQTQPHKGFAILKRWEKQLPHGSYVFTSNVDGQFQTAGFSNEQVYECHGSIHYLQCLEPCSQGIWPADGFWPAVDEPNCLLLNEPPTCPQCNQLARPNILMFGDWSWLEHRSSEQAQNLQNWLGTVNRPVVIELGAGTAVPSVRHFSEQICHQLDAKLIRINPNESQVPRAVDVALPVGAADGLLAISEKLGW